MAQMLIRNIPDDVLAAFKAIAREKGLSQEEAARRLIEDAVRAHDRRAAFVRTAEEIRAQFRNEGRTFSDSTEIIRQMRDTR